LHITMCVLVWADEACDFSRNGMFHPCAKKTFTSLALSELFRLATGALASYGHCSVRNSFPANVPEVAGI
jgi:hypothetical protein